MDVSINISLSRSNTCSNQMNLFCWWSELSSSVNKSGKSEPIESKWVLLHFKESESGSGSQALVSSCAYVLPYDWAWHSSFHKQTRLTMLPILPTFASINTSSLHPSHSDNTHICTRLRKGYIAIYVGLARTICIHRIWPYTWWFPCQKYRIYTVYIWSWPTLYICLKGHLSGSLAKAWNLTWLNKRNRLE